MVKMKICWQKWVEENRDACLASITEPIRPFLVAVIPTWTAEDKAEINKMPQEEWSRPLPAKLESIFDMNC